MDLEIGNKSLDKWVEKSGAQKCPACLRYIEKNDPSTGEWTNGLMFTLFLPYLIVRCITPCTLHIAPHLTRHTISSTPYTSTLQQNTLHLLLCTSILLYITPPPPSPIHTTSPRSECNHMHHQLNDAIPCIRERCDYCYCCGWEVTRTAPHMERRHPGTVPYYSMNYEVEPLNPLSKLYHHHCYHYYHHHYHHYDYQCDHYRHHYHYYHYHYFHYHYYHCQV